MRDRFIRWQAAETPETRFTLVDIDEASLGEIGPWPWRREKLADLAELLIGAYGAEAVAMDLVMPSPGPAGNAAYPSFAVSIEPPVSSARIRRSSSASGNGICWMKKLGRLAASCSAAAVAIGPPGWNGATAT